MKNFKWILVFGAMVLVGCSPQTNDRIVPSVPTYTQTGLPNPLVLFDSYLAVGLAPNSYQYPTNINPTVNISLADTTVTPIAGQANLAEALTNYNATTWVGFPLLTTGPIDLTSGNYSELTFYVKAAFAAPVAPAAPVTTGGIGINGLGVAMTPITITTNWQAVTLALSGTLSGPATTEMFVANFYAVTISAPVTTYFDQVQLQ